MQEVQARVFGATGDSGSRVVRGFQLQIELRDGSNDYKKLQAITDNFIAHAMKRPEVLAAFTPLRNNVPQLKLTFKFARAETLGVALGDAYDVLQASIGSTYVNQFFKFGQTYQVYVQADGSACTSPDQISRLFVKSRKGRDGAARVVYRSGGNDGARHRVPQYNIYPTAAVLGAAADGFSSGQVIAALEQVAAEVLPESASFEWTAMSYQENWWAIRWCWSLPCRSC